MWLHLGHIRCLRMLEGFRCRYILGPAFSSVCFHVNDSNCYSRTYLISGKNVKWPDKLLALARHLLSRKTFCNLHLKSINLACANILYIHTHTIFRVVKMAPVTQKALERYYLDITKLEAMCQQNVRDSKQAVYVTGEIEKNIQQPNGKSECSQYKGFTGSFFFHSRLQQIVKSTGKLFTQ